MCSGGSDWTCLQPGFPIRKSSDRSLVIDSPRLIADSYVLLRFLVPRHPPCALKNLSHKDIRCSRPLCSSQHTGGPSSESTPAGWCRRFVAMRVLAIRPEVSCDARALRTQQRVRRQVVAGRVPRSRGSCTCGPSPTWRQIIDVPPLSTC